METTYLRELNRPRVQLDSSGMANTQLGSHELVKWEPSENDAASTPTANNHPLTAQNKTSKIRLDSVSRYTVGIICALAHEKAAVIAMLDEQHDAPLNYSPAKHDGNTYSWGLMRGHNVAVVSLGAGSYGTTQAAHTVAPMLSSLPEMRFGLLVGIGAGIPQDDYDIRLGDVAISIPGSGSGGVHQYDAVKAKSNHKFEHIGFLNKPSDILLKGVQQLQSNHLMEDSLVPEYLQSMVVTWPKMGRSTSTKPSFSHQGFVNDLLFPVSYGHVPGEKNCGKCDHKVAIQRTPRDTSDPEFHYGVIASGNTLVKDSIHRDELVSQIPGCICFEMEAAGVMNKLPCLVIRGICDYADSHKNDMWQNYAAAVAAGYAKELMSVIAPIDVATSKPASAVVQDIKKGIDKIESVSTKTQDDLQQETLKKWLDPPDTSAAYKNARDLHQAGTCHWFLTSKTFSRWKEGHTPLIWIHGIPGSGKTILSSSIIEELKTNPRDPADVVLYFYFEYKTTANATFDGMIRNFASHLFPKNKKAQEVLQKLQDASHSGLPPTQDLVKTLESMLGLFNRVQIVIDALDEIKCREDLLRLLAWIEGRVGDPDGRLKLIATSRKEEDIEKRLSSMGKTVVLSRDVVEDDIKTYVEEKIREDPDLQKWHGSTKAQNAIKSTLIERSDGMFRWVFCQLDALRTCCNYEDLVETLESLPQTLEGTYTRILERITSEKQKQRAITILRLLLSYGGTLRTEMLLDAIIVNLSHNPAFDPINRFPEPRDLARICGALVTVDWDAQHPSFERKPTAGSFRIAHFSVREYLTSPDQVLPEFKHAFQEPLVNVWLTQISLGYLGCIPKNLGYRETMAEYPFTYYAMKWPKFARMLQQNESVINAINDFFAKDDSCQFFVHLYNHWEVIKNNNYCGQKDVSDLLWILLSLQLHDYMVTMMSESKMAHLFSKALRRSHLGMLRPSFPEFNPFVPLRHNWGRSRDRRPIMHLKRFIPSDMDSDSGRTSNNPCKLGESPLYFTTRTGWTAMVTALLQRDTECHTQGGYYGTALNEALYYDEPDIVTILQTHYDALDSQLFTSAGLNTLKYFMPLGNSYYLDPWIQHALKRLIPENSDFNELLKVGLLYGHDDSVHLALRNCRPTESQAVIQSTFMDAVSFHQESVGQTVFRLVDTIAIHGPYELHASLAKKALIETYDELYDRSTLHWATKREFNALTSSLILLGADVNHKDRFGQTPLHFAAEQGQTRIAEIMIIHGANTKASDESYQIPLRSAFLNGHLDTCWTVSPSHLGNPSFETFLNDIDSKVESRELPEHSSLHQYLWNKSGLRQRIEPNDPEAQYFLHPESTLHHFCERVRCELESLEDHPLFELVERLYSAIGSGKYEHVREALHSPHARKVVNARSVRNAMGTPLHLAVSNRFHGIFCLLLDEGFNPEVMDLRGRTPMQLLELQKCGPEVTVPIVSTLIKRGWSLDDLDNPGKTYLDILKIQEPSQDGTTCLHYAARGGCAEIVNTLLDNGADIAAENEDGQTPLDYARAVGQLDVFGIRLDSLIRPSKSKNMTNRLVATLQEAHFTHPQTHKPTTIAMALKLHKAVRLEEIGTVRDLLDVPDVDLSFVNLVDSIGRSALHWAVERKNHRIVQLLLEYGAAAPSEDHEGHIMPANYHANIKDDEGQTPLHYAAETGQLRLVKTLIEEGAHTWVLDNQARTPRELADIRFHREVADWLKNHGSRKRKLQSIE